MFHRNIKTSHIEVKETEEEEGERPAISFFFFVLHMLSSLVYGIAFPFPLVHYIYVYIFGFSNLRIM